MKVYRIEAEWEVQEMGTGYILEQCRKTYSPSLVSLDTSLILVVH